MFQPYVPKSPNPSKSLGIVFSPAPQSPSSDLSATEKRGSSSPRVALGTLNTQRQVYKTLPSKSSVFSTQALESSGSLPNSCQSQSKTGDGVRSKGSFAISGDIETRALVTGHDEDIRVSRVSQISKTPQISSMKPFTIMGNTGLSTKSAQFDRQKELSLQEKSFGHTQVSDCIVGIASQSHAQIVASYDNNNVMSSAPHDATKRGPNESLESVDVAAANTSTTIIRTSLPSMEHLESMVHELESGVQRLKDESEELFQYKGTSVVLAYHRKHCMLFFHLKKYLLGV